MKNDLTTQNKFLAKIGLKTEMTNANDGKDDFILSDKTRFQNIPVPRPARSEQQVAMDDLYGMYDADKIHTASGLRLTMTVHESYYSETWKIVKIFILVNDETDTGKRYDVTDVDFEKEIFYSSEVAIPFREVIKLEE